jgi:hypothetical protein
MNLVFHNLNLDLLHYIWCDNIGATTYLTDNHLFHAQTKHIEIDCHFVRDKVASRQLTVQFLSSKDQIANIFSQILLLLPDLLHYTPNSTFVPFH